MTTPRKTAASQTKSLLMTIARLGLRCALRRFLHPTNPSFVAVLVLPPGATPRVYIDAASELFAPDVGDYEIPTEFNAVFIDNANKGDLEEEFRSATVLQQTLFLLTADSELPTDFRLAIDHYAVMPLPSANHVRLACHCVGLGDISRADAELLAKTSSFRLQSVLTIGRPIASAIGRLRALNEEPTVKTAKPKTPQDNQSLDDLIGFHDVKEWAGTLARDVAAWQAGDLPWSEVDRGAVFVGSPGTGKTRLCAAIAAACGMTFLSTSPAKWQSKGHLGDFLKAMRADFERAVKQAPCILHLEEIDSIGDRDADTSNNAGYTRTSVNGILEAVDGAFAAQGVVIVGSTNKVEAVDPALLRSGRIERVFRIGLPTPEERMAILASYLEPHEIELPSAFIRLVSNGMSGADLEKIAREAKRKARSENRAPMADDVIRLLPAVRPFDRDELRRIAVHEAGHVVAGLKTMSHHLVGVTINDVELIGPSAQSIGRTTFERARKSQMLASDYLNEAAMLLGGIAAEEVVFGNYSDGAGGLPGTDLALATDIATRLEFQLGLGDTLVSEIVHDNRDLQRIRQQRPDIRARVADVLRAQFERAKEIISKNRIAFDDLVEALLETKALSGEVVVELLETAEYRHRRPRSPAKRAK